MENLPLLIAGLVLGIGIGVVVAWLVLRARLGADASGASAELAQSKAETAQAKSEASRAAAEIARAREEAATANADRSTAEAALAIARAETAGALAHRDAAVRRADEIAADREQLTAQFKALSAEVLANQSRQADAAADQRQKQTDALLAPVRESLERFNTRLNEVEQGRVELASTLKEQVKAVQLTGEQLKRETNSLVTALRKPQVRGSWGELQLKRILEITGMLEHCDFVEQETTQTTAGTTIRPDVKVTLAEGKFVYVDSKVPLTSFLDAHEAADESERNGHLKHFAKNVRDHVDLLSRKDYFKVDGATPDFVVLFLPSEALLAEACGVLPDLHEYALARGIVVATPSTLIATLKTIAYSWKQAALADSAKDVQLLARELYDRLAKLGSLFDGVGRSLTSAVKSYNSAVGSLEGRVFVTARKLKELKVVDGTLDKVKPSEASVRPLTAPELTEDAAAIPVLIGRERAVEEDLLPSRQPSIEELAAEALPLTRPASSGTA